MLQFFTVSVSNRVWSNRKSTDTVYRASDTGERLRFLKTVYSSTGAHAPVIRDPDVKAALRPLLVPRILQSCTQISSGL